MSPVPPAAGNSTGAIAVPAVNFWSATSVPAAKARTMAATSASVIATEPPVKSADAPLSVIVSSPSSSRSATGSSRKVIVPDVAPAGMTSDGLNIAE